MRELKEAIAQGDKQAIADELGDLLFSVVNSARHLEVNAKDALRGGSARKFKRRFRDMEAHLPPGTELKGKSIEEASTLSGKPQKHGSGAASLAPPGSLLSKATGVSRLPFSGNVETIPLDEVFHFVSTNSLDGSLVVAGGGARLTLYFENAHMFFPFSAKRGTYSLGKILRQTGVLSREALEKHLESARKNRLAELRALEEQASPEQLEEARRKQDQEEIHDVFLGVALTSSSRRA